MRPFYLLTLILLVAAIPAAIAFQEDPPLNLEILVLDNYTGAPIDSVLLTLWSGDQLVDQAYSDASGFAVLNFGATGIEALQVQGRGSSFTAGQNYPNPFMSETVVGLEVFEPQKIGVSLVNIKGQRLLYRELQLDPGTFGLQFSLGGLPAGIYILQLKGEEQHNIILQKTGTERTGAQPGLQVGSGPPPQAAGPSPQAAGPSPKAAGPSTETKSRTSYSVRAEKPSYETIEVAADPESPSTLELDMQRNNQVVLQVVNHNQEPLDYTLRILDDKTEYLVETPGTLFLKSGVYWVFGETDTCIVDFGMELASRDTTLIIVPDNFIISFYDPETMISSPELIAIALEEGEIDYETSLLYRAWALYGDPRLPAEYNGNVVALDDGTSLFREVIVNQNNISEGTMELLEPFRLRPNDPGSYFSTALKSLKGTGTKSDIDDWESQLTAGSRARVWVPAGNTMLSTYAREVNDAWNALFVNDNLLGAPHADSAGDPSDDINPDSAIDLYFIPIGSIDPRRDSCIVDSVWSRCAFTDAAGWACPDSPYFEDRSSSGYIIIDQAATGSKRLGTIAHELFHTGQFRYDLAETHWIYESTAVWAEFTVLRRLNRSPQYIRNDLKQLYKNLDKPLDRDSPSDHAYTAYLYPLFIQMEGNAQTIAHIWMAARAEPDMGARAYDELFPFSDHFKDFALRNWNEPPVPRLYSEIDPGFDSKLRPPVPETLQIPKGAEETIEEELAPLSILYKRILVDLEDEDNLLLKFDLSQFTEDPDAGIDAIVTIDGKEPDLQRWSDREEVTFCLDDENEAVTEIILIISNASLDSDLDCNIEIERVDPCGFTFYYDVEVTWEPGEEFTTVYTYSATVELEREESGDLVTFTGIDTLKTVSLHFIPGEASGSIRAARDYGVIEITFINDLRDSIPCADLYTTMGMDSAPTEIITLIYPEAPPYELPEGTYGWNQVMLAHHYDGEESAYLMTEWECGPPDSELKAFKEYTKSYDIDGNEATVKVRIELRSE